MGSSADVSSAAPTAKMRKRILLVDDHPLMRVGLAQLINDTPDLVVCCEAGTADEALGRLSRVRPELVTVDLTMPGRGGIELIKDLHALYPELPVLVVSMHDEQYYAERALRAGARGYIMKEAGAANVLQAIRHVLDGGIYLSPRVAAKLLSAFSTAGPRHSRSPIAQLSDREFDVFQRIGKGRNTRAIAREFRLSEKTVDVHRASIRKKLGLRDSTALVAFAVRWLIEGELPPH